MMAESGKQAANSSHDDHIRFCWQALVGLRADMAADAMKWRIDRSGPGLFTFNFTTGGHDLPVLSHFALLFACFPST